jgi:peptidoglycan/xylan/chitin deacetylase (PgdA/CDA1 family)
MGVPVIRMDHALPLLENPIEGPHVAITFDDGYRDLLENALPVLRELELPATIFVPTELVRSRAGFQWFADRPPALSWAEIGELVLEGLVDVQSHSRSHAWLPRVDDRRARDEIEGSKHDLENNVPYDATTFCFPAGLYGDRELQMVREAGYRAAVTTDPGVNPGGVPSYQLRRTLVFWADSSRIFKAKLSGLLDRPSLGRLLVQRARAGNGP